MKKVTVYTTVMCPFCMQAKALLKQYKVTPEEISVERSTKREEMMVKSGGMRTVPQIFIGEMHIGGFSELQELHHNHKLAELLED